MLSCGVPTWFRSPNSSFDSRSLLTPWVSRNHLKVSIPVLEFFFLPSLCSFLRSLATCASFSFLILPVLLPTDVLVNLGDSVPIELSMLSWCVVVNRLIWSMTMCSQYWELTCFLLRSSLVHIGWEHRLVSFETLLTLHVFRSYHVYD